MSYWNDPDSQLEEMARCATHTSTPQLRHRMALVELWEPGPGDRVLEIGWGHGDTTVALAQAVGPGGMVVAIDRATAGAGGPITLADAHTGIKSSDLGQRIDFRLSTDLLSPDLAFQYGAFDLVVFSHCSWYMSPAIELQKSFERVRPWARRLGYAEWDLVPRTVRQMPHFAAVLLQIQIRTVWSNPTKGNIYSLILLAQARSMAERTGWSIVCETTSDSSRSMEDGKVWEVEWARHMADQLKKHGGDTFPEYHRDVISTQAKLLEDVSGKGRNMSLDSYVFVAE